MDAQRVLPSRARSESCTWILVPVVQPDPGGDTITTLPAVSSPMGTGVPVASTASTDAIAVEL
ncbi:MAG: hypothetical protein ACI80K_004203, partial [Paracoccaceae bacterium]